MADAARGMGSLPVANVQALAETCNNGVDEPVPRRYISKDPSAEEVVSTDDSACAIPVIDFRKLLDPESSEEECARLGSACHHWGFFQLINHGVPDEVIANLMKDVVAFFKQPLEAKKECAQRADSLEGYGQAFVVSEDQKLDWADMLYLIVQPRESRDMRFWPTRPASFRDSVDSYSLEASKLAYHLLEFMAKGVGADPASLRGVFQGQVRGMRVNYYPPCRQAADRVLGLSPHTDPNGLTLLLQMNHDVQGLQVSKDGRWFPVQALDGAFVVNVGDALEIVSNGAFKSVEHRAVIHPTKERISAALFHFPDQDRMLGPLPQLVKKSDRVRPASVRYGRKLSGGAERTPCSLAKPREGDGRKLGGGVKSPRRGERGGRRRAGAAAGRRGGCAAAGLRHGPPAGEGRRHGGVPACFRRRRRRFQLMFKASICRMQMG